MIYVVIVFLWLSMCLYLIFGGADFGAGIIELFSGKKSREKMNKIMYESMAPVWEANHMWLIIAIVILFVGFPKIYTVLSTYLHIPIVLMLVGIIARGTAFTFRHYDVYKDRWINIYTYIFYYGSLLTPFFLGLIAAATLSKSINPEAENFGDLYIFSWLNWFGIGVGLFTTSLCAYLANIFALREIKNASELKLISQQAIKTIVMVVISGTFVFLAAHFSAIPLFSWVLSESIGVIACFLATLALLCILYLIKQKKLFLVRILAGFQIVMILVAATYQHFPNLILLGNGQHLSLLEDAAPEKTISALGWALLIGSVFILPFLFYLMISFRKRRR